MNNPNSFFKAMVTIEKRIKTFLSLYFSKRDFEIFAMEFKTLLPLLITVFICDSAKERMLFACECLYFID